MNDSLLWQIRHFIYQDFADTTLPPSVDVTAAHFSISTEEAGEYYKELHNRHAFFLNLETMPVRMANPFSGIPTDFKNPRGWQNLLRQLRLGYVRHPRRPAYGRGHRSRLHGERRERKS